MTDSCTHLAQLRSWCRTAETALRLQRPERQFLPEEEEALAASSPSGRAGLSEEGLQAAEINPDAGEFKALTRRMKVLTLIEAGRWTRPLAPVSEAERRTAARALLRAEPVAVHLQTGRMVFVTDRSYACLLEITQHHLRVRALAEEYQAAQEREEWMLAREILFETGLHRQATWAHAFTADGRPAGTLAEAPEWWDEIGPQDEAQLLTGLYQVTYGRLDVLGKDPAPPVKGAKPVEDYGLHTLLALIARDEHVEPAELYNRRLGQTLAARRITNNAAPPMDAPGD